MSVMYSMLWFNDDDDDDWHYKFLKNYNKVFIILKG